MSINFWIESISVIIVCQLILTVINDFYSAYVTTFMRHLCEPEIPNTEVYSDGVPKNGVSRQNILTRIGILRLIQNKVFN